MTITLNLPLETEQALRAQAQTRGVSLDVFLQTIISNQAAAAEPPMPLQNLPRQGEELNRAIDGIFDTVQVPPGVGEGSMRRENWYR